MYNCTPLSSNAHNILLLYKYKEYKTATIPNTNKLLLYLFHYKCAFIHKVPSLILLHKPVKEVIIYLGGQFYHTSILYVSNKKEVKEHVLSVTMATNLL